MRKVIIVHYGEIGVKGKNREWFERKLLKNIKLALGNEISGAYRRYGRIICELSEKFNKEFLIYRLSRIPGIRYFLFGVACELDISKIKDTAIDLLEGREFKTFKVEARRSNKDFPFTSIEVNRILGELISSKLGKKVKLEGADLILFVEICEKEAFLSFERYEGIGGLPVSCSGKVISLISGGIDSPVASFLFMKRGCQVVFLHFWNETITSRSSINKVKEIVKKLSEIQLKSKAYLIPFKDLQAEIIKRVPAKYRMLIYRRIMIRIANHIAEIERALGIVTGDSLGQVASQTLENLNCIYEASELPVFAPLIGMDKEEIVRISKFIGTYDLSILPSEDCCSFMIASHPETKGSLELLKKFENSIHSLNELIQRAIENAEVLEF